MEDKEETKRFLNPKKIGSGTYGIVFSAYDTELKKQVAVK